MKRTLKLALLSLVVGTLIVVALTSDLRQALQAALVWIEAQEAWGPFAFILFFVLATVLFLPGSILTLGAAALFGRRNRRLEDRWAHPSLARLSVQHLELRVRPHRRISQGGPAVSSNDALP
jgi:hypothetical protein